MGFFGLFKKKVEPKPDVPAELIFQPAGAFEVASCPGQDALKHLWKLREAGRAGGFQVVLLGDEDDANGLAENRELSGTAPEEYLRLAMELDIKQWLQERREEYAEQMSLVRGDWPAEAPKAGSILAHLDILTMKPKEIACLAKIPTAHNWQVSAYIGMGGWNDCPDASVLTAFARRWHERYGAEVVSITHDVMEFTVSKPPTTREAATELANEQYLFCYDIVEQGVGTIPALAATLLNANYWYFWWD